jgi:serine/threonine protein kinase
MPAHAMKKNSNSLPNDTRIDGYTIRKTLTRGGFSVIYLATDTNNGGRIILKEYMPSRLATRDADMHVIARDDDTLEHFRHGRKLFLQEASALASLKHPNIVNVVNFFSANGTVYIAMEYAQGQNLQAYIKKHRGYLSEQFMRTVFPPLLDALRTIHNTGFLHLDIKPGNIHLRPGGKPLLLDFGAVHPIMQTRSNQPTQVVTPGFSPIEQYTNRGYLGPWTDIYAFGATMRTCIEEKAPDTAPQRHENDRMRPTSDLYRKRYSKELLKAIDWAMEVDPLLRPQSVDALLDIFPRLDDSFGQQQHSRNQA